VRKIAKFCAVSAITLGLAGVLVTGTAYAATSGTARPVATASSGVSPDGVINDSCGPDIDPSTAAHSDVTVSPVLPLPGGGNVALRAGWDSHLQQMVFWTRVQNAAIGDLMHLDWSDDAHQTWHVCENSVATPDTFTPAVNQWGSRYFRACDYDSGTWTCTGWYRNS
jgi:hypothetical protein